MIVENKKHKLRGKIGTVTKVSKCFVFFNDHETKQIVRMKPSFLQIASDTDAVPQVESMVVQNEAYALTNDEANRLQSSLTKLSVQQQKGKKMNLHKSTPKVFYLITPISIFMKMVMERITAF